jgi:general stress protein YciG
MTQNQVNKVNQGTRTGSSNRGFAAMDPEAQRSIASEGGRAAHAKGTAHEFTSEEAAAAGRKGGQARARNSLARQNQHQNSNPSQIQNQSRTEEEEE